MSIGSKVRTNFSTIGDFSSLNRHINYEKLASI